MKASETLDFASWDTNLLFKHNDNLRCEKYGVCQTKLEQNPGHSEQTSRKALISLFQSQYNGYGQQRQRHELKSDNHTFQFHQVAFPPHSIDTIGFLRSQRQQESLYHQTSEFLPLSTPSFSNEQRIHTKTDGFSFLTFCD